MNTKTLTIFSFIFILVSPHLSARDNVVWQAGPDYVAVINTDQKSTENDHPVQLSPEEVHDLLQSIQLSEKSSSLLGLDFFKSKKDHEDQSENNFTALFNKQELRNISPEIAKALSQAGPNEDVSFSVSGRKEGAFGKSVQSTTARVFHSNNKLHLIFGEVNVDLKKKYRRQGKPADVPEKIEESALNNFRLKIGSRNKDSKPNVDFIIDNIHSLNIENSKRREDWLMIDLPTFREQKAVQVANQKRKDNIVVETTELQSNTQKINADQQALKEKVDRLEREMQARDGGSRSQSFTPASVKTSKSLEARLVELKQLYEKGIITENAYNEKMKLLLNELQNLILNILIINK